MEIRFNVTDRKKLVKAIGEITGAKPMYMRAPTMAYSIGEYTVDRAGAVSCDDGDRLRVLRDQLIERGYEPVEESTDVAGSEPVEDRDILTIVLPEQYAQDGTIENIRKIVEGKKDLFSSAFRSDSISVVTDEGSVSFPWFHEADADHVAAYTTFIDMLGQMASKQSRVAMKNRAVENEKYAMRCFLLRMGMIGYEYKKTRRILLENLSGSSAFRDGRKR